jgi:iduronate 2-sulfatase
VNGTNKNTSAACKHDGCCGAKDNHYCLKDLEPGTFLLDQTVKNIAVERLNVAIENWNKTKQPFFVGMGTHRPHLGWEFPIEYELPTPTEDVPEAKHKLWPQDVPHLHYHECAEMAATYFDSTNFGLPFPQQNDHRSNFTNNQADVRRAYYGCISYVDGLIGELLQALKDGGAEQHTAVVFTGDHGWHL